jgi:hypothetical protein
VVDAAVGLDRRGRTAEPEGLQGVAEGRPLGPVEVQQSVVDVEEDGAEAAQAATWRGR